VFVKVVDLPRRDSTSPFRLSALSESISSGGILSLVRRVTGKE
jgi:hypothetical protein